MNSNKFKSWTYFLLVNMVSLSKPSRQPVDSMNTKASLSVIAAMIYGTYANDFTLERNGRHGVIFGGRKKSQIDELMSALAAGPIPELAKVGHDGRLETRAVSFVFVLVSHPQSAEFHKLASDVIRLGLSEHAMLVANAGGLLQFAIGPLTKQVDATPSSERFVSALAKVLGNSARVVYGSASAHVGTVGTDKRKTWGFHPVAIEAILKSLLGASPGKPLGLGTI